jgi:hypothetical protein
LAEVLQFGFGFVLPENANTLVVGSVVCGVEYGADELNVIHPIITVFTFLTEKAYDNK